MHALQTVVLQAPVLVCMKIPAKKLVVLDKEWCLLGRKARIGLNSDQVTVGRGLPSSGHAVWLEPLRKPPKEKQNHRI